MTTLCLLLAPMMLRAQEKKDAETGTPSSDPATLRQQLAKLAGEYKLTSQYRPSVGPESEDSGTAKITVILDGRYLREEASGTMLGKAYSALRLYGYNEAAKQFEGMWLYTGNPGMMTMVGTGDGTNYRFDASFDGKDGAKSNMHVRLDVIDENSFLVSLYTKKPSEGGRLWMTTKYDRKK
jgi:hypothetical protein